LVSRRPRRLGWVFVGLYCLGLLLLVGFLFSPYASDMSGILLLFATLPWSYFGDQVNRNWGLGIGVVLGLVLNGAIAYWIGYGLGVMCRRWCPSSSAAPSRR
jgi:apolipoprotein N-acyltransferase